jgi:cellulose synthase operon protein C
MPLESLPGEELGADDVEEVEPEADDEALLASTDTAWPSAPPPAMRASPAPPATTPPRALESAPRQVEEATGITLVEAAPETSSDAPDKPASDEPEAGQSVRPGSYSVTLPRSRPSRSKLSVPPEALGEAGRKSDAPRVTASQPPTEANASLERELQQRITKLAKSDAVGAARTELELGLLAEWHGEGRERAAKHYAAARARVKTLQPALTRLRRSGMPEGRETDLLEVLDEELAVAESTELSADLWATKARIHLSRAGNDTRRLAEARKALEHALRLAPKHPASLRGLEATLRKTAQLELDARVKAGSSETTSTEAERALGEHLGRLGEEFAPDGVDGDAQLAAWISVERSALAERRLGEVELARRALTRASALVPGPGPVRAALSSFLARHDRDAGLVECLRAEAEREPDPDRAARLQYAVATIALDRLHAVGDAIDALTRAKELARPSTPTRERALERLALLLDQEQDHARLVEVRVQRLELLGTPEAIAYEYMRLAESYGRLGRADLAVDAAERALARDPANTSVREALDAALVRLGRHTERVRLWLVEANSERGTAQRVSAFLRAADVAHRLLDRHDQAVEALRAAWLLAPGHPEVFDMLTALLRGAAPTEPRAVGDAEARIDLYTQAAKVEADRERKIALYEKVLGIVEDELARPEQAIEVAETILAIDPKRRSAVLALERNARRSGAHQKLLRALLDEASASKSPALTSRLLLDAAAQTERDGDRERALVLVDRAREAAPENRDAERARVDLLVRMGRHDEARRTLVALAAHDPERAFDLWLEVAELDQVARKQPLEAVEAYRRASTLRPAHPLPKLQLVQLLRRTKAWTKLVAELAQLEQHEGDPRARAGWRVARALVEEHCLDDDRAALASLEAANELMRTADAPTWDPFVYEESERILARLDDEALQLRLYARWLEQKPPAAVDHGLRIALARALERSSPEQAISVLQALVGVVPQHVPALRELERKLRNRDDHAALSQVLLAQAAVLHCRAARAGGLWEVATYEDRVGAATTLEALSRILELYPQDSAALDQMIRVAGRLVSNVAVPHPAMLASKAHLLAAIRARRELALDPVARAAYLAEEAMLLERDDVGGDARAALAAYREALGLWPDSLLVARGLERLSEELDDPHASIEAQLALAKLVEAPSTRASHLVRAAELTAAHLNDDRRALELYEVALDADPENREAARALAGLLTRDPRRLVDRLRPALDRARSPEQIVGLGGEIGGAYLRLGQAGDAASIDYGPGVLAMRRVLTVAPEDVPSLMLMSRLLSAQKAWAEAKVTLARVVELTGSETKTRVVALFALADIHEGPLADASAAELDLRQVLEAEPTNKRALERLHALGLRSGDTALARGSLERLAEYEADPVARTDYQLRLAELLHEAGDEAGRVRALVDAVVTAPHDGRAWSGLVSCFKSETEPGATSLAQALEQVLELARVRRRAVEPRWLLTLGLLEINVLKRPTEGLAHLTTAATTASTSAAGIPVAPHPELRAGLGLGLLGAGRNREAVQTLRELLTQDAETLLRLAEPSSYSQVKGATVAATGTVLSAVLACLDAALATEGRAEERLAVEEVRAALGELASDRLVQLRKRRLDPEAPFAGALAASEIVRVLVPDARSPLVDVALAVAPIAAKALRFELASLGIGSRERIGPRDGHPTRAIADRIARALGIEQFELYLTPSWQGAVRVYPGDPPAIVGPVGFAELPESEQVFALGRLLTRVALGVSWLDEIPTEIADAFMLACLRSAAPAFAANALSAPREHATSNLLPGVQRAMGRRQRKQLEELLAQGQVSHDYDMRAFSIAVRRSEYRAAYVLSGNLLAGLDYLRRVDSEIARAHDQPKLYLQHPVTNELLRWTLSAESFAERRRVGAVFVQR